ncbi:MAG: hypothetical protein AAF822_15825 [Pseudomonadota bacterium]
MEDARHLPTEHLGIGDGNEWDYSAPKTLPDGLINNAFTGWDGTARVMQRSLGISVEITAEPKLTTAIVYSPGSEADFFCFEPVSQAVDAHNRAIRGELIVLETGGELGFEMTIGWRKP